MVKARLAQKDAKENGWLLDGYPRSFAQAQSLEEMKIRPDVYIVLDVFYFLAYSIFLSPLVWIVSKFSKAFYLV